MLYYKQGILFLTASSYENAYFTPLIKPPHLHRLPFLRHLNHHIDIMLKSIGSTERPHFGSLKYENE